MVRGGVVHLVGIGVGAHLAAQVAGGLATVASVWLFDHRIGTAIGEILVPCGPDAVATTEPA